MLFRSGKHYYSVDHIPSFLWDSSTWEISRALLPYVRTVMSGPEAWAQDDTIRRAIEVRDGEVHRGDHRPECGQHRLEAREVGAPHRRVT